MATAVPDQELHDSDLNYVKLDEVIADYKIPLI